MAKYKKRDPIKTATNYTDRIKRLQNEIQRLRHQQYKLQQPNYKKDIRNLKLNNQYNKLNKFGKALWRMDDRIVRAHEKILAKTSKRYKQRIARQKEMQANRIRKHHKYEDRINKIENRKNLQQIKLDKYATKQQLKHAIHLQDQNKILLNRQSKKAVEQSRLYARGVKLAKRIKNKQVNAEVKRIIDILKEGNRRNKEYEKKQREYDRAFKQEYFKEYKRRYGSIDRLHEKVTKENYKPLYNHYRTVSREINKINKILKTNMVGVDFSTLDDNKWINGLNKSELIKVQEMHDILDITDETLLDNISSIWDDTLGDISILKTDSKLCDRLYTDLQILIKDKKMKMDEIAKKAKVSLNWLDEASKVVIAYRHKNVYIKR